MKTTERPGWRCRQPRVCSGGRAAGGISSRAARLSSWQHQFMESIDDALAGLPQPEHDALQRVIDLARSVAPHPIDGVSYGVPELKVAGKPLIGVSASAHHLSIFPFSPAAIDVVRTELDERLWYRALGSEPDRALRD